MHIVNLWGMFFSIILPLAISIVLVHIEGVEEGKKIGNNTKKENKVI